jgi:hypothetical protein
MAFTVTPRQAETTGSNIRVACDFVDGATAFKEWLPFTSEEQLRQAANARIAQITDTDATMALLKPLLNLPLTLSPPVPPPPTPFDEFAENVGLLNRYDRAITLGVVLNTLKTYTDLKTLVTNALLTNPEWINAL